MSLGRIALDIISNDDKELLKNPARCVKNFLSEKLYIRTNDQIGKVPLSDMGQTMPMLEHLRKSYEEEGTTS